MSESQGWCWMESGGDSADQRSKENGQVGGSEAKYCGELVKRALYVMVASLNEFCFGQVANGMELSKKRLRDRKSVV